MDGGGLLSPNNMSIVVDGNAQCDNIEERNKNASRVRRRRKPRSETVGVAGRSESTFPLPELDDEGGLGVGPEADRRLWSTLSSPSAHARLLRSVVECSSSSSSSSLSLSSQCSPPSSSAGCVVPPHDGPSRLMKHSTFFSGGNKRRHQGASFDGSVAFVDRHLRLIACGAVVVWACLAASCYVAVPPDSTVRLSGWERNAPALASLMLLVSFVSRMLPLLFRRDRLGGRQALSGIVLASVAVQLIAIVTDATMALGKNPVMVDPVLGTRVHLLRWCEWTPLAFLMTFMTEGIDAPLQPTSRNRRGALWMPYAHAACQGLSTLCGIFFPFCPGVVSWSITMVVSCVLFVVIFPRLWQKRRAFLASKRGSSVHEVEIYDRIRLSYQLLATCTVTWSMLVTSYFFSGIAPHFVGGKDSILSSPALPMVCECFMDVVAKNLYLNVILSVHDLIFDESARTERRLDELRRMMSAVWESSSDVIIFSVRSARAGTVTTMVSPTFVKMCERGFLGDTSFSADGTKRSQGGDESDAMALLFDLDLNQPRDMLRKQQKSPSSLSSPKSGATAGPLGCDGKLPQEPSCRIEPKMVYKVEVSGLSSVSDAADVAIEHTGSGSHHPTAASSNQERYPGTAREEIKSVADLIVRAWGCPGVDTLLMHDFIRIDDETDERHTLHCEAKVNRLDDNELVVVVRDISERFRRFEAEKQVITEATARNKDAEANRFTRHEVKNGLLAAIGLCDSLRDTLSLGDGPSRESSTATRRISPKSDGPSTSTAFVDFSKVNTTRCVDELDKSLREVLDTILSEAMARDVVHEVYEPKMEKVDIRLLLKSMRGFDVEDERFPIITKPDPLPPLLVDPQLLMYIHRNAVSNACKYGKKGGAITTLVRFDRTSGGAGVLEMNVENLPGEDHDKILALGDEASRAVFAQGRRLHRYKGTSSKLLSHSSGDGAWIMKKCARTLRGDCSIRFKPNRTVFNLRCPASSLDRAVESGMTFDPTEFRLPSGTWGIAIDDSKIQRKLMDHFFRFLGIDEPRRIVVGADASEIQGFDDFVVHMIDQHPNDYFFLIADENLDIVEGATHHITVSGSICIENIRHRLLPEQERRLLAVVRSANDSSHDIAIYNSRAHGFLPKAPIRKDKVLEMVAPLWEKRYFYKPAPANKPDCSAKQDLDGDESEVRAELNRTIKRIDELCTLDDLMEERWAMIWENLHKLKGDVSTFCDCEEVSRAVEEISTLRGPSLPSNFTSRWTNLRSLILSKIP